VITKRKIVSDICPKYGFRAAEGFREICEPFRTNKGKVMTKSNCQIEEKSKATNNNVNKNPISKSNA
jgi:hypothetical protein